MSEKCAPDSITIDNTRYVKESSVRPPPTGKRCVVVVDRGWIFAGDVEDKNGRVVISRAVWVFRWESVGFAAVVADPKKAKADIRPMSTSIDLPAAAELFRLPVDDNWGL